jgi:UDP-3-O-[3-hydroxymyristoyl] glucosamine N-acyltransferase
VSTLASAGDEDLAFSEGAPPAECDAAVLLCTAPVEGCCCITTDDPKLAFIRVLEEMFHVEHVGRVDPGAAIEPSATVHKTAILCPGVVVMSGCTIGARSVLFPNVVLYPNTQVGADCRIHAGAVIGADGFSYHPCANGLRKVPQIGHVVIEDGVEIGANSTIDRAFLGETRIGQGSKLDNQVHIGHNGVLGRSVIIAAQTGLAGSVTIGDGALLGGQVGVVEHTHIGTKSQIGAQSGVNKNVADGQAVLGTPAEPAMKMKRIYAALRKLPEQG